MVRVPTFRAARGDNTVHDSTLSSTFAGHEEDRAFNLSYRARRGQRPSSGQRRCNLEAVKPVHHHAARDASRARHGRRKYYYQQAITRSACPAKILLSACDGRSKSIIFAARILDRNVMRRMVTLLVGRQRPCTMPQPADRSPSPTGKCAS